MGTKIQWADETWNPLVGCSKAGGPGCDNCYAIGVAARGMAEQHKGLTIKRPGERVDWTGEVRAVPKRLDLPSRWRDPRRVFVNSLSDVFHPEALKLTHAGYPFVAHIVAEMVANPRHTFLVLTKRPGIMANALAHPMFRLDVNALLMARGHDVLPGGMSDPNMPWPPHIHWGTSVENNDFVWRAKHLQRINGITWVSAEPLLSGLPDLDMTGLDWIVVGGESGGGARRMDPHWATDIYQRTRCTQCEGKGSWPKFTRQVCDRCRASSNYRDVAFFFKQAGTVLAKEWEMSTTKGDVLDEVPWRPLRTREYVLLHKPPTTEGSP